MFPEGVSVVRQRPKPVWDRYANQNVPGSWEDPDELPLADAYVGESSSSRVVGSSRTQILEFRSLFCDPAADVKVGDRIKDGDVVYEIEGIPDAPRNPFTGWQPVREIPLTRGIG